MPQWALYQLLSPSLRTAARRIHRGVTKFPKYFEMKFQTLCCRQNNFFCLQVRRILCLSLCLSMRVTEWRTSTKLTGPSQRLHLLLNRSKDWSRTNPGYKKPWKAFLYPIHIYRRLLLQWEEQASGHSATSASVTEGICRVQSTWLQPYKMTSCCCHPRGFLLQ